MPKKTVLGKVTQALKEADDISNLLFGRRLTKVVGSTLAVFGSDLSKKILGISQPVKDPNNPYSILEVNPDASDAVVKWAYRALAHEYHPDTGRHPDGEKMKELNKAFEQIQKLRSEG